MILNSICFRQKSYRGLGAYFSPISSNSVFGSALEQRRSARWFRTKYVSVLPATLNKPAVCV